jgi:hypothetical protein
LMDQLSSAHIARIKGTTESMIDYKITSRELIPVSKNRPDWSLRSC